MSNLVLSHSLIDLVSLLSHPGHLDQRGHFQPEVDHPRSIHATPVGAPSRCTAMIVQVRLASSSEQCPGLRSPPRHQFPCILLGCCCFVSVEDDELEHDADHLPIPNAMAITTTTRPRSAPIVTRLIQNRPNQNSATDLFRLF